MKKWDIRRSEIIMCDLGDRGGSVQAGIRPCVVVSNDYGNIYSSIYTVIPLTTKHKTDLPTHVELAENSYALCEQITTISEQRVLRTKNCFVSAEMMNKIENGIRVALNIE